ncbi:hypothetical protein [Bacillus altitudinis]|uniref:hypothetical protein n=1 Tax=Bacillus altitudinis TaxID=293387 RepID=UPI001F41D4AE|nr:hypothetical protein [Bacillus altitudinis]
MKLVKGKVCGHGKGFAFVRGEEFGEDDILIGGNEVGRGMNGERVMVGVREK